MSATTLPDPSDRKRLHITPFNPTLLDRYIPPTLRPIASDISFHTVQTYPDRGFGYVELPVMEAEKLKKKLNGSTLKGTKVRIEDAKPEKKRKADTAEEDDSERKMKKKAKKSKPEDGVLPGYELEEGRRVKRGWKDDTRDGKKSKKTKKQEISEAQSLEGKKMRFKTTIPPNAEPVDTSAKAKAKKDKTEKKEAKKTKRKAVVEEFARTKKPVTTGESINGSPALRYEDGTGWVDEAGNVVEAAPKSKKPKRVLPVAESDASEDEGEETPAKPHANGVVNEDISSEDHVENESIHDEDETVLEAEDVTQMRKAGKDSISVTDTAAAEEDPTSPTQPKAVHPLEALFKRPAPKIDSPNSRPRPGPIDTSFSFFNSSAAEEDSEQGAEDAAHPPQTPHTKADLEWRSLRSAAPTPDTAAIGRKFSFPFAGGEDEEEEDDEGEDEDGDADEQMAATAGSNGAQEGREGESEFRKWFFEHRGDLNRSWKKRRREERKTKRQRENRRVGRRIA